MDKDSKDLFGKAYARFIRPCSYGGILNEVLIQGVQKDYKSTLNAIKKSYAQSYQVFQIIFIMFNCTLCFCFGILAQLSR